MSGFEGPIASLMATSRLSSSIQTTVKDRIPQIHALDINRSAGRFGIHVNSS